MTLKTLEEMRRAYKHANVRFHKRHIVSSLELSPRIGLGVWRNTAAGVIKRASECVRKNAGMENSLQACDGAKIQGAHQ